MSLSFKIERPSSGQRTTNGRAPTSHRTFAAQYNADSSEDEAEEERVRNHRELITDFDSSRPSKKDELLSIPSLPDRDFRAVHLAKKRKKEMYLPEGGAVGVMRQTDDKDAKVDPSAKGVDQMNSRPVEGGLRMAQVKKEESASEQLIVPGGAEGTVPATGASTPLDQLSLSARGSAAPSPNGDAPKVEETEDQKALRELLAGEGGLTEPTIDVIHMHDKRPPSDSDADADPDASMDETLAFRRDVALRPDSASLEDYARVPVGQFGAALLRGMGWKEGTAATKKGREGPVEAYVPKARPSLLGIGAKPMQLDATLEGSGGKKEKAQRPERRYVPLVRKVTDRNARDSGADDSDAAVAPRSRSRSPPSRRSSRSPPRSSSRRDRYDSDREYDSDRRRRYDSDRERGSSRRDRDRDGYKDRDREGRRHESDRESRGYRSEKDDRDRRDRDRRRDREDRRY